MKLEWGVESLQSTKKRPNEDRYRLLGATIPLVAGVDKGQLFAVFDGIGGAPRGMEAAQKMCDALTRFFLNDSLEPKAKSLQHLLLQTSCAINRWGCMPGTSRPLGGCAGTLAWFYRQNVTIFHAGDTVGYLLQEDGLTPLTREHGSGKVIDNYFGRGEELLIDVFSQAVEDGDVLILVTDGVTKALSGPKIGEIVFTFNKGLQGPQRAAQELCLRAKAKGSQDDITAVIVEVVDLEDEG